MQVQNYINELFTVIEKLELSNQQGMDVDFEEEIQSTIALFKDLTISDGKLIFIGNGGSAAIASHMAIDYWKSGGIPALCFNDGAQLTCLSNDYGYEAVFSKPIQVFARPGDILIAISSSGQSPNILQGVETAISVGCKVITFSGFSPLNPLRKLGDLNIYCASYIYGFVELVHQLVLHMILDLICTGGDGKTDENSGESSCFSG